METFGCPNVISETISGESNALDLLFRVVTNVLECFKNRGYTIDTIISSEEELLEIVKSKTDPDVSGLTRVVTHSVSGKKCLLIWVKDEKIGVKHIKQIYDKMEKERIPHCCMVCEHQLSVFGKKAIEEFNTVVEDKHIEYFEYVEMLIDITKHFLVPKHIVLTPEEKEIWKKEYSIQKETQCPKMHRTDAISRYYGLRKGDLVKVIRKSEAGTEYVTYRIVI